MSGPVTAVARVEDVQIFLKDPVYIYIYIRQIYIYIYVYKTDIYIYMYIRQTDVWNGVGGDSLSGKDGTDSLSRNVGHDYQNTQRNLSEKRGPQEESS